MLKQSLEDQVAQLIKDLKKADAEFTTSLVAAEANLAEVGKSLAAGRVARCHHQQCVQVASVHEVSVEVVVDLLKASADATQVS